MFYDIFSQLCEINDVKPSRVCLDLSLSKATATKWKNGSIPSGETLQKIADYFNVSTDYLLGNEQKKIATDKDDEIQEMIEELKNRPGMRILFSKTRNATKEDLEKIIQMVDIMKGGKYDE